MEGFSLIQLHYLTKGSGEPLILLHGNGGNSGFFKYQLSYFSRKYQVIAVDTRGHGRSKSGSKKFSLEQFAEDLKNFLDEKGITKAHILGFSDGANIGLIFALRYQERVQSLILNSGNLYPEGLQSFFLKGVQLLSLIHI